MHRDLLIKSRTLGGTSDLTLLAPITAGLVPSLESITYKTRIKRLLKTLNSGRVSSQEYSLLRAFSDAVERVGKIHSVRVAIVEPNQLLLSVTFDGNTETYLRVLWQKVGTLLDIIFCNTDDYVSAWGSRYEDWAAWVRRVQIETDFFFGTPGLTVDDVHYLRGEEQLRRRSLDGSHDELLATQLLAVQQTPKSAEQKTWQVVSGNSPAITSEIGRQGLRALALFYRLAALYLPNTPDGGYLHRAARDILLEFVLLAEKSKLDEVILLGQQRFDEQLRWLLRPVAPSPQRVMPALPSSTPKPDDPAQVQAGILRPYPASLDHGCLLLIAFDNRTAAADFLDAVHGTITTESTHYAALSASLNLAFTVDGLQALGLSDGQLEAFPLEFREGMQARASVLGDVRINHPRRWQLPRRNMALDNAGLLAATVNPPQVELSAVHAVVQVRMASGSSGQPVSLGTELSAHDPLTAHVAALLAPHPGVKLMSVQPMVRNMVDGKTREHFGYVDGLSQPVLDPALNGSVYNRNQIHLGEILWGYDNEAETAPQPDKARDEDTKRQVQEQLAWLKDGSFLVIRKLKQDVAAFNEVAQAAAAATGLSADIIKEKMMGRRLDGTTPLPTPLGKPNDFDFSRESAAGAQCPFHSHIRRSNPRLKDDENLAPSAPAGQRTPRIMRRGMSYGPRFDPASPASADADRGLVFMAYNASIAEQFEVVQRWISGGNSSGGFSGQSDPLMGVPVHGQQRYFRFEEAGKSYQIALDGYDQRPGEPTAFVRLQWGAYLFTPSIKVLDKLSRLARSRASQASTGPWSITDGWKRIQALIATERMHGAEAAADAWKAALEDPEAQRNFESASIWAAIRAHCAGVLRTPYGVLVADRFHIDQVLHDEQGLYSVSGYHDRMTQSIGEIYLGLDDQGPGCPYRAQATPVNAAINALSRQATFDTARMATTAALERLIASEIMLANALGKPNHTQWELNLDVKEVIDRALEALCQAWFGLPKKPAEIKAGSARWDWQPGTPPLYPGHFTAPSRYFFQPQPGASAQDFGNRYGAALREAFGKLVKRHRDDPAALPVLNAAAPLTDAILQACPRSAAPDGAADDLAARTMIGAMMGFLPTLDGNLRLSMNEWLRDGTFWSLRAALAGPAALSASAALAAAQDVLEQPLKRAMLLRPSPELIWRTATRHAKLGEEALHPGDKIVLALVSSTHATLESDPPQRDADVYAIFGGQRKTLGYPTHACPGYEAAFGAMLGILYALMESPHTMRPSVAPLALVLEGPPLAPLSPKMPPPALPSPARSGAPGAPPVGQGHTLLAGGDSWLCYQSSITFKPQNIANCLVVQHGFKVETQQSYTAPGNWLHQYFKDINLSPGQMRLTLPLPNDVAAPGAPPRLLQNLCNALKHMIEIGQPPTAILLSAGGNDVTGRRLAKLVDISNPANPGLKAAEVAQTVDVQMRAWLEYALDQITATCTSALNGKTIPIVVHGYDFPVPDARHALAGILLPPLLWLYPSFVPGPVGPSPFFAGLPAYDANHVKLMQALIERLNAMQKTVAALPRFNGHVIHADLTGTLSNAPLTYKEHWDNELHPTQIGFTKLTDKLVMLMQNSIPAL